MNWAALSFDWNQVRAFLATAQEGSFSAGARALGLTQPTLGRQVAALEEELKVTLFERSGSGLSLTETGQELLEEVQIMARAATRLSLLASGQVQTLEGCVRVTASDVYSAYLLPAALLELRKLAPRLEIEVIASNNLQDLVRREADIAIRHLRPTQSSLIARRIRHESASFYAARHYLDTHGRPQNPEELATHTFVAFGDAIQASEHMNKLGVPVRRENFRYHSLNGVVAWELVRQGLGVSIMSDAVAQAHPELEVIALDVETLHFSSWLVTHRELHTSRRIRLVYDTLAQHLQSLNPGADGP